MLKYEIENEIKKTELEIAEAQKEERKIYRAKARIQNKLQELKDKKYQQKIQLGMKNYEELKREIETANDRARKILNQK